MSLAVRLLLALGAVALFVTGLVGVLTRDIARSQLDRSFERRIAAAMAGAHGELAWEARTLAELLTPLCAHDSFVDAALLDLEAAGGKVEALPSGRGIAIQQMVPAQSKAWRLDDLLLLTGEGTVLGATTLGLVGTQQAALARTLSKGSGARPKLVISRGQPALQVHCARRAGDVALGLIGRRKIKPLLERVGNAYGVSLRLSSAHASAAGPGDIERTLAIDEVDGLEVSAVISRKPLEEALRGTDKAIALTGAIALLLSVALAILIARGLSRPLVELADQARVAADGRLKPVKARGGRELIDLANAFNLTLSELLASRKRLARTERIAARREVARQVAHEIKNPLAPIRAAIETLRRLHQRDSPQFEEYFDEATKTVLDEVHRIKSIVSAFTEFARMPAPSFEPVDLQALAQSVAHLHDGGGDSAMAKVTLESAQLPLITADHDQLVQVLTNLVQNGIEAASGADRTPALTISLGTLGSREIAIEVRDNGPGVSPELQSRLFEPYVSSKPEGTGLGLAIVQTIVQEHGGEVRCKSSDEEGSVFEVVLPVAGPKLLTKAPPRDPR